MSHLTIAIAFGLALLCISSSLSSESFKPDNSLYTQVLKAYVNKGAVDYKGIKADSRFAEYITMLQKVDTASIDPRDRLAFWINMYNAWTIKIVVDNYPIKSITDLGADLVIGAIFKTTVWDKQLVEIKGAKMSLNSIEHDIIRKYRDARIHFAIVCASKSCPPLRTEAYNAASLSEQLDEQARVFLADTSRNKLNVDKKELQLSKIFSWFAGDFKKDKSFEKGNGSLIKFIARYVPKGTADKLLANEKDLEISYLDYDWSLNE